ncbi:hypothetical protein R3P38DRAFT_3037924 [Favolaschia claudopus]|uniref:phytol kinase n=1 Tax=Favolaschia claudopus TaxID=2862362 RepID=A0AAW0ACF1_9AGAR
MHPALHPDSLKALPISIRRLAVLACKDGCTIENVARVRDAFVNHAQDLSPSQRNGLLPVLFHNLSPQPIPSPEQLEAIDSVTSDAILRATICLDTTRFLHTIPQSAGIDLWPRVWAWSHFIATYREFLPEPPSQPHFETYFIVLVGQFRAHEETWALISRTPGFRAFLAEIWKILPSVEEPQREFIGRDIGNFLKGLRAREAATIEELIDGAGGTVTDLAQVVIEHMKLVAERPSPGKVSGSHTADMACLMFFIQEVDQHPGDDDSAWFLLPFSPLFKAFLRQDGLVTLLTVMQTLIQSDHSSGTDEAFGLASCLLTVTRILVAPIGVLFLSHAVSGGLLEVIVLGATLRYSRIILQQLRLLLRLTLPYMVFHGNIIALEHFLPPVLNNIASAETFRHCPLFSDWENYRKVAEQRIAVLHTWTMENPQRACNNIECASVDLKTSFKRCSGCRSSYYCSPECQSADWSMGRHRTACRSYGTLTLHEGPAKTTFTRRERDYLRAMLHHDYTIHVRKIYAEQIEFIAANPACSALLTVFDYTCRESSAVWINIHSATASTLATELRESSRDEYDDLLRRAQRSGGAMQLHVLRVVDGSNFVSFVIPLRCDTMVWDEVCALSSSVDKIDNADGQPTERFQSLIEVALKGIHV